ncbi:MAG: glycosyltransferase [Defluviitaleaceae bacterium]|nr:glycosyltransferase [Defluviitaleaceae bacterium]
MKIALFTETYLPVVNGVVTHVKILKEGLESLGHNVIIVTADSRFKRHKVIGNVIYCPAIIKVKKIYNYGLASPFSPKRLQILKKINPDIIHIHNEFGIGISGILIAHLLKIPVVYTLHTMYDDYIYYIANKRFCKIISRFSHSYLRKFTRFANAITGPSPKVEEYIKKCGIHKNVNIIANSVELDLFSRENADTRQVRDLRSGFGFFDDDFIFAFCGRIGKEKNISQLIEFINKTVKPKDKIKLLIIGSGPYIEQHQSEVKDFNLEDIIKFAGRIEHDALPPYYAACDAYITASISDTCSISMLEAMAMNLPVLHIRDDLNHGQVIDGVNGYIFNDAEEMYVYMNKLKDMPKEQLKEFGKAVRASIINSGGESIAGSVLQIYSSVIATFKY